MTRFNHRNVLGLIGVCIDAGEAPFLLMPYMEIGSLLSYLKKERPHLTITEGAGDDLVRAYILYLNNFNQCSWFWEINHIMLSSMLRMF